MPAGSEPLGGAHDANGGQAAEVAAARHDPEEGESSPLLSDYVAAWSTHKGEKGGSGGGDLLPGHQRSRWAGEWDTCTRIAKNMTHAPRRIRLDYILLLAMRVPCSIQVEAALLEHHDGADRGVQCDDRGDRHHTHQVSEEEAVLKL